MKKPIRFYISVLGAKIMIKLMRLMKRNATNLPGEIMLIFYPDLLKHFDMPENVIAVTGTNGKTTVSNMIGNILKANGYDIINNSFGGNVDTGIASLLLDNCTLSGGFKKDTAVLEVDERSAARVLPYVKPDWLVCTNLQRDSMKRNAHTEFIFNILNSNIPEKTKLILNGDDLISSRLAEKNPRTYFGIDRLENENPTLDNLICDIVNCPVCGNKLEFAFRHYNHIGRAKCSCGFSSPDIDFDVKASENNEAVIMHNGKEERYKLPNNRITDLYNTVAAVTFSRTFGLSYEQVAKAMSEVKVVKSRYDSFNAGGKEVLVSLAKGQNPVACSGVCDFIRRESGNKAVIMILEDLYDSKRTSENIAWIYETDFEFLKGDDIKQIIVGGKRADDYMVRLLIAGIDKKKIVCCRNETDTPSHLKPELFDKLIIMYDLFNVESLNSIKEQLKNWR
ncbi:MurT ligase domain-containing protein [Porcipelethomonas ammoniilytica]|uniref:MurT ligase domain-containing protein n=1 Tax=Porcipelethomonas ammoniilytica TaxID=2981722 RepID=UPI0008205D10|nr:MurT ligase domain-containing protein [Porcipelethomonas ammoniilytica]MCU6718736.1 MurT ligase domain-containing protein [Porcipelethomonas ammoniilytica]SCI59438.1 UDP-N-acetylmuramate--L-alanine ligase [uncultured Ruminococcus sp.]